MYPTDRERDRGPYDQTVIDTVLTAVPEISDVFDELQQIFSELAGC
jgi:hypothetical protein